MGLLSCPGSFLAEMQNGQNGRDWSGKAVCFDVDLVAMLLSERINSEGTELQIVKGTK